MLRSGSEYLNGLRDGRVVVLGRDRITDVVAHPGFRAAAHTVAAFYDLKLDPARRADFVVDTGDDAPYSAYFLMPRTRDDLETRRRCHAAIAEQTFGLFGRSPDHVASLITGLAMQPGALAPSQGRDGSANMLDYYRDARARDAFVAYAVLPGRSAGAEPRGNQPGNRHGMGLRVIHEDDAGIVLRGTKALATAAVLADEVWIGNLQPIESDQTNEAITCVVPCAAPGLQLWSRKAFAEPAGHERDYPLASRFDETDAVLVLDEVRVPWNRVFVHSDPVRSSDIYIRTPAHSLANHQSAIRSLAKVRLIVGLAHRIATITGAADVAPVRDVLGRLAGLEATLAALVDAQIYRCDRVADVGVGPNRRYVYATLNWCQELMPVLIDVLRELSGAGTFKFPASFDALDSPDAADAFVRFWDNTAGLAHDHMRLFKLSWDLVGSEFAGRQQLYERFYAGPPFVVRGHNYREAPWDELSAVVTRVIAQCPRP